MEANRGRQEVATQNCTQVTKGGKVVGGIGQAGQRRERATEESKSMPGGDNRRGGNTRA